MITNHMARRLALGILTLAWCALATAQAMAQQNAEKKADKDDNALPLNKVVMFNSGVGYFEHRGDVEGDTKIDLQFRVEDINDLLKSMILEDRGGGKISTVTYGSRDPITKTLKTFPIDLTDNPTLGRILDQVRGERVQIDAPTAVSGVLLGVEKRKKEVGKDHDVVETEYLNLLTDMGLRSVPMDSIGQIKLTNEKLDAELRQALAVLATGHNTDKKTVSLNMLGQGKRPVRVGYIQATPVWKTSYRLVLSDKDAPYLQGWAIVENTTEADWNNVSLTLMSGRPISYTMDLYEPLYVQRPVERLNLFASLRAQTYGQDMFRADERLNELAGETREGALARRKRAMGGMAGAMAKSAPGEVGRIAADAAAPAPEAAPTADLALKFEMARNAVSAAAAGEVGELFQYVIGAPVNLARQKSAMLPIVNETVKGDKVSIYNQAVQAKHPLNGLRLVNSTDLHLMQGPITVYDGGAYAGDAKIEDLSPKADRLISYALDLKTEVVPETKGSGDHLISVKLVKGTMLVSRKHSRTHTYTVKNSDSKTKTVLVELPLDTSWKLVSPKEPTEKTRDLYRFAVKAEPGKPATLTVEEEQVVSQSLALTNLDDNSIVFYINQKEISPAVKAALQEVVKRKVALQQVAQERQRLEQQIVTITQEQDRIRQNMGQLDRNTELYKRYVQKFGAQEDSVEKMRGQIQELTTAETHQRESLDAYLINLNI
jgi:hypothetical protein